jgi:hypothetical protein
MYVEELKHKNEWEQFLQDSPNATFYHAPQWKQVLEEAFHNPLYLAVRNENGELAAVCPGFILKTGIGKIYQSTPRSDYAGPVVGGRYFESAYGALVGYLRGLSHSEGVTYAKINLMEEDAKRIFSSSTLTESNVGGVVEIDLKATSSALIWNKTFTSKLRNKIRGIEKNGFQAEEAKTKADLKDFYKLYSENMKFIGASPFSYSFMEKAWDLLHPENMRIWLLGKNQRIAATANFKYGQGTYGAYVGMDRKSCRKYPIMPYLILKEINKAEEEGRKVVSLGSTPNDPRERHYLQKREIGGSFRKQTTVWVPSNSTGHFLVLSRNKTINTWKKMRNFLPQSFKRGLEKRLEMF